MAIPDFQTLMLPLLRAVGDGNEHSMRDLVAFLSDQFGLTEEERQQLQPSGLVRTMVNRSHWARKYLKEAGLVEAVRRGVIRERGKQSLRRVLCCRRATVSHYRAERSG